MYKTDTTTTIQLLKYFLLGENTIEIVSSRLFFFYLTTYIYINKVKIEIYFKTGSDNNGANEKQHGRNDQIN
jgi:hypothetical protein